MAWSTEERLLLHYCGSIGRGQGRPRPLLDLVSLDWRLFLEKAGKEAVTPLLYSHLAAEAVARVPSWVMAELGRQYYAVAARNTVIFSELGKILTALNNCGIRSLVLKGAALAETIYRNPALRSMADVDLMIRKDDLAAVDFALRGLGYTASQPWDIASQEAPADYLTTLEYRSCSPNSPSFHLHWHFINSTLPNQQLIAAIDLDEIWQAAVPARIAGVDTLTMAAHHLLLHLAEHCLRLTHSVTKLSYLCDIDAVVTCHAESLDWQALIEASRRYQLHRMVWFSLALAGRLLGAPIPGQVLRELRPADFGWGDALTWRLAAANHRFPGLTYPLHLMNQPGLLAKAGFVVRTFLPPRQVMAQRCSVAPDEIGVLCYLRRVLEIFWHLGLAAARAARAASARLRFSSSPLAGEGRDEGVEIPDTVEVTR